MKNKILAVLLSLGLVFGLVACKGGTEEVDENIENISKENIVNVQDKILELNQVISDAKQFTIGEITVLTANGVDDAILNFNMLVYRAEIAIEGAENNLESLELLQTYIDKLQVDYLKKTIFADFFDLEEPEETPEKIPEDNDEDVKKEEVEEILNFDPRKVEMNLDVKNVDGITFKNIKNLYSSKDKTIKIKIIVGDLIVEETIKGQDEITYHFDVSNYNSVKIVIERSDAGKTNASVLNYVSFTLLTNKTVNKQ